MPDETSSPTRLWVDAFADEMEKKLALNRHKGDRNGWSGDPASVLIGRLLEEVGELVVVLNSKSYHSAEAKRYATIGECADIANFAMMIADVAGKMRPKP